jgi:Fic family protein
MNSNTAFSELSALHGRFCQMRLAEVVDHALFNRIAIVHHGSAIEGSTLSMEETQVLLTDGTTAKGKPMEHHLMVTDHFKALSLVMAEAAQQTEITPAFLQGINAAVNSNTGKVRQTMLGTCDDTKGDFRLGNVTAGNTYFVNYDKVVPMINDLCTKLQARMAEATGIEAQYRLSFEAHYYLVSIHPWFDGNGRTSRLLMNFIQACFGLPLTLVFAEDKAEYIAALTASREADSTDIFCTFMAQQAVKYLSQQVDAADRSADGFDIRL